MDPRTDNKSSKKQKDKSNEKRDIWDSVNLRYLDFIDSNLSNNKENERGQLNKLESAGKSEKGRSAPKQLKASETEPHTTINSPEKVQKIAVDIKKLKLDGSPFT